MNDKFNVGDWVCITKSSRNWTDGMDKWDGKAVKITEVSNKEDKISIKFKDSGRYEWDYHQQHFREATVYDVTRTDYFAAQKAIKVGDTVKIQRSWPAWNDAMDVYVGKEVVVTVRNEGYFSFANSGGWNWHLHHCEKVRSGSVEDTIPNTATILGVAGVLEKGEPGWYFNKCESKYTYYQVFTNAGIEGRENILQFQKKILGYSSQQGSFPYCLTKADLWKLLKAIEDYSKSPSVKQELPLRYEAFGFKGTIVNSPPYNCYFKGEDDVPNDIFFRRAGFSLDSEKYAFQKSTLGYTHNSGTFPYCNNVQDVRKLLDALVNLITGTEPSGSLPFKDTSLKESSGVREFVPTDSKDLPNKINPILIQVPKL